MSIGRAILLITLVIPGLLVAGSSLYSFNLDYATMERTERYVEKLVRNERGNNRQSDRQNDRQLELAYHRSLGHRINALANGTWGFIGLTIAAMGVHGISTIKDEMIQDQKKASK